MQTRNRYIARSRVGSLLLLGAVIACARAPEEQDGPAPPESGAASDDERAVDARGASPSLIGTGLDAATRERLAVERTAARRVGRFVPNALVGSECTNKAPLETCTWAGAADAVVVARVRDVRLVDTPVAGPAKDAAWKWYRTCSTTSPALEIDVDVERDFRAKLSGRVTVHMGKRQVDMLAPSPNRGPDGSLQWLTSPRDPKPLAAGQKVLMALHYVAEQAVWSLMGELVSGIDGDGTVHVPRAGCSNRTPTELDEKSMAFVSSRIGSCLESPPSAAAQAWRAQRQRIWGSAAHPARYLAAECIEPDFAVKNPEADETE